MGAHSSLQKAERRRWAHEICNAKTYRISQRGLRMHAALGTLLASPGASARWASGCGAAEAWLPRLPRAAAAHLPQKPAAAHCRPTCSWKGHGGEQTSAATGQGAASAHQW